MNSFIALRMILSLFSNRPSVCGLSIKIEVGQEGLWSRSPATEENGQSLVNGLFGGAVSLARSRRSSSANVPRRLVFPEDKQTLAVSFPPELHTPLPIRHYDKNVTPIV